MATQKRSLQLMNVGLHTPILVCEGDSDVLLLQAIYAGTSAQDIYLVSSKGKSALGALCGVLYPAYYIRDRDYDFAVAVAEQSLQDRKLRTVWPHQDLESYLLHPDWMLEALQQISQSKDAHLSADFLLTEDFIAKELTKAGQYFAADHASYTFIATYRNMTEGLHLSVSGSERKGKAEADDYDHWANLLVPKIDDLGNRLAAKAQDNERYRPEYVHNQLQQHYQEFSGYADDLDLLRLHFSGKRILMYLVQEWQIKFPQKVPSPAQQNKKDHWELLRDLLQSIAKNYASQVNLLDDKRLEDFGLLAKKILGKPPKRII